MYRECADWDAQVYADESPIYKPFAGRHNVRDQDTIDQRHEWVVSLTGTKLPYRKLVKDNGLASEPARKRAIGFSGIDPKVWWRM